MGKQNESKTTYMINDVSQRVGLSQKRIREYEKGGLIRPAREPKTNNRRYTETDIRQIQRIKALIHEHGFTVACLRYFLASAPCWIIFDCKEKETCPTYSDAHTPCYELARKADGYGGLKNCDTCPIYLNRGQPKSALLEKP